MTKIRSILVASDLTEASDPVVRAAGRIAAATGAELHALHAFDFPPAADRDEAQGVSGGFQARIADAERALDAQLARLVPPEAKVGTRCTEIYVAHRAVLDAAAALGADLIVLGPHSHRRLSDPILGTTADRVLRASTVPCLVVRAPLTLPLSRVLAAVDRSDEALPVLRLGAKWSVLFGGGPDGELAVVHVLPQVDNPLAAGIDRDRLGDELHRLVEEARADVAGAEGLTIREVIRQGGTPTEEILGFAGEWGADLIVVATRGEGMVKRFLMGSVASGVARAAACPVLLLPPPRDESDEGSETGDGLSG